ncbi:MAG: hypothetical protein IKK57_04165 [Clostridia bacterium]|nr:hypothetical protein [Clostridia bacterium]
MFDNIGGKLKTVAQVSTVIGMLASLVIGVTLAVLGMVPTGLIIAGVGCVCSWLASLTMYGLGELIDETARNREVNEKILACLTGAQPAASTAESAASTAESAAAPIAATQPPDTPVAPVSLPKKRLEDLVWRCSKCSSLNDVALTACRFCKKSRE